MRLCRSLIVSLGSFLLLTLASVAQSSFTVNDGNPRPNKSAPTSDALTNDDIIGMTSLALPDEIIVDKIRSAVATDFDTSLEGLKKLKASKVSNAVIAVMVNPKAASNEKVTAAANDKSPLIPEEPGAYLVLNGKLVPVAREAYVTHTDGKFSNLVTYGVKPIRIRGKIANAESPVHAPLPTQDFVCRAQEGFTLENFRLYKLIVAKDSREYQMWSANIIHGNKSDIDSDAIPLVGEKIGPRTWRVKASLEKGEYGFFGFTSGPPINDPTGKQPAQGWIYTFSVQ